MATIYDAEPNVLIEKAAGELKKVLKAPDWSAFVKTGVHKERPPANPDWWYFREVVVLRSVYVLGPIGTNKLRTKYGGKKNRGFKPEKFYPGSGKIIRTVLQQLEKEKFIVQQQKGVHKGRAITPKGKKFLDTLSKK